MRHGVETSMKDRNLYSMAETELAMVCRTIPIIEDPYGIELMASHLQGIVDKLLRYQFTITSNPKPRRTDKTWKMLHTLREKDCLPKMSEKVLDKLYLNSSTLDYWEITCNETQYLPIELDAVKKMMKFISENLMDIELYK